MSSLISALDIKVDKKLATEVWKHRESIASELEDLMDYAKRRTEQGEQPSFYVRQQLEGLHVALAIMRLQQQEVNIDYKDTLEKLLHVFQEEKRLKSMCKQPTARQALYFSILETDNLGHSRIKRAVVDKMAKASINSISRCDKTYTFDVCCTNLAKVAAELPSEWLKMLKIRVSASGIIVED